ncbi:hypothetical protein EI94DRAFT_1705739 [Lactarius quietus]|nr:hypothetical protein EI94DRAFT_1705739 [Lactarius quietus]
MVDRGPKCRSKQEVALEKQAKVAAKEQAERQKSANIQRVAKLKSAAKQKTRDMERQANNPVDKITQLRAKRTINQPDTDNKDEFEGPEETPWAVKKTKKSASRTNTLAATSQTLNNGDVTALTQRQESTVIKQLKNVSRAFVMGNERLTDNQGATFEDDDPKFAALLAESDLSGSEYKGSGGPESETESDEELATGSEGPELENEEPDTKIQVKAGKKPKKGLVAQDQISAAVAAISAEPSPSPSLDHGKITAGWKRGPLSKPVKSSHPRSGLVPNWQQVQRIQTQTEAAASVLPRKSSGISVTGSEIDSDTITCNTSTGSQHGSLVDRPLSRAASSDADASYGYGGFAPDDKVLVYDVKLEREGSIELEKKLSSRYKVCCVQL